MHMKMDKRPIVTPGMEHRTVAIQLIDRGCCKPGFYGEYQPGKLNMSSDEFYDAIERYEKVLSCCCSCTNPRRSKMVISQDSPIYTGINIAIKVVG